MFPIASHKFDTSRQQVDHNKRDEQGENAQRGHLVVSGLTLHAVSDQHDCYYWTDEGYDHLRGTSNAFEHVLPHVLIDDRRIPDTVLEAMAARGPLYAAIAFAVVAGLIGLAGSVGLERVERASEIASRV
ncbi:hypothetical protein GYN07_20795 [Rhizobium leguminosarum bv. viciae 248]|uniref:hypothetical protein n=1 Tax=Rhizobium leguminosarum TaxID=384 RepID=UPI000362F5AF|nr:hypothetical protein [Rhizobium leguminosarum]QHW26622.1 hypothetical protein GYN07_20795 [Rhizobium leguminosarum bv. viciae 248]